jgi:toxin ParE1/3/4
MSKPLVVLPEATAEIEDAARWYQARRLGLGIEFATAVDRALNEISKHPLRWPRWLATSRYRRSVLRRFPYVIFYEIRQHTLEIVAVAHARRRPGYWIRRSRRSR